VRRILSHYKCRFCATWAITAQDGGKYVHCNGCGGAKKFEFFSDVTDKETTRQWHKAKALGVLHLPEPNTTHTCAHCGVTSDKVGYYFAQLWLCKDCYKAAQTSTAPVLLTPEEQEAKLKAQRDASRDYDNNHQFTEPF
jgi:hypothetical protein